MVIDVTNFKVVENNDGKKHIDFYLFFYDNGSYYDVVSIYL